MPNNSTTRFSDRVDNYVKYRPGYPEAVVSYLKETYKLPRHAVIADIGSGTGICSELFLKAGYTVIGVEPNKEMREKSVELLQDYPGFSVTDGTAEATKLPDASIGLILAGQAFHWFNNNETKLEFTRILKPGGVLALLWNERLTTSAFGADYDALIVKYAKDYTQIDHRNIDLPEIEAFFKPHTCQLQVFPNYQDFDFEGLKGRLLSSSYMPLPSEAGFDAMLAELEVLFNRYQTNGRIRIDYETKLYSGVFR